MATLNTLRTRFGVVLSAVIAIALLAFIFSLKTEMGFSGNDPIVAEIDGEDVTYTEYQDRYNSILRQSGMSSVDEQQAVMLNNATWQSLISQIVLQPGFKDMGLSVSDVERMAMIRGEIPVQALYNAFADPSTGIYNINAVNSFLFSSQGNPEAEAMWTQLLNQARDERATMKYLSLFDAGVSVNALEVAKGVEASNMSYAGRWASKRYTDIADSLVTITNADIKRYYEANKAMYKQQPSRAISYVTFDVEPSADDMAAIEVKATELGAGFAKAKDIKSFVRESRSGSVAANYVSAAALPAAESEALVAGKQYGPESDGSTWKMSRVESSLVASDTLSVRHIVLSYTDADLADSLLVALRKGSADDFAQAASTYSLYSESAQNGGYIGEVPFSAFTDEFAAALAPIRKGQIVKVESGDMIQLIKADAAGRRVRHYKLATIELPIVPSQATRTSVHNTAGLFAVESRGGVDAYKAAVSASSLSSHNADLLGSTRNVAAVRGSEDIVRWANRAEVGDVSEIFKVDGGYAVAMLTSINTAEYRTLKEVAPSIRRELLKEKKFEIIASQLSGDTFEAQVESLGAKEGDFKDVNFGSYYVSGLGVEPRVIGAISSTTSTGTLSSLVEGANGAYIFVVDSIVESEDPQSAEAEEVRAVTTLQQNYQQMLSPAIEALADIKDMRGATL